MQACHLTVTEGLTDELLCCRCAALALQSIDRRVLYGQEVRVNWASQRDTRPDTSNHFHIFVGDLAAEVRRPPFPPSRIDTTFQS